jgi:hypothetical protein
MKKEISTAAQSPNNNGTASTVMPQSKKHNLFLYLKLCLSVFKNLFILENSEIV